MAKVTPAYIPFLLMNDYNMHPHKKNLGDITDLGSDQYWIGVRNREQKMNILIKFDNS